MAGLLDYLFEPGTYSPGSGLLSRLQASLAPVAPSQGFAREQATPAPVGGYQMPRLGQMADFTPPPSDPAALPPNAQPTQGQVAPAAPAESGGFLNTLRAFGNPGGLLNRIADAATVASGGTTPANATAQYLVSKGLDPAMARSVVSDPSLLRAVLPSVLGTNGQTDDIKEYQFAKKEDPSLTFEKFMGRKRANNGEYGLNYVYGTDKDGKTVAFAPGKDGNPKQVQFPDGINIARGFEKIDAGTKWILRDKQTGSILGEEPKNVSAKEAEEKVGQARGTAQAALANGADLDAEATKKKIDELISHGGFNSIFGSLDQFRPSWTMDASGKDARTRFEQLKGTAFLSAYSMLKGGGAITDIEGQKAGAAMARLDRSLSEDEAKQALIDFKEAVDMGLKKLRRAAGGEGNVNAPNAAVSAHSTNLKSKYGLD